MDLVEIKASSQVSRNENKTNPNSLNEYETHGRLIYLSHKQAGQHL